MEEGFVSLEKEVPTHFQGGGAALSMVASLFQSSFFGVCGRIECGNYAELSHAGTGLSGRLRGRYAVRQWAVEVQEALGKEGKESAPEVEPGNGYNLTFHLIALAGCCSFWSVRDLALSVLKTGKATH